MFPLEEATLLLFSAAARDVARLSAKSELSVSSPPTAATFDVCLILFKDFFSSSIF